jgi:MYXO-CTERM domain-containing protein
VCGDTECKTECGSDDDCQSGFICEDKACKLSSNSCSDDGNSVVDQNEKSTDCDPYRCEAGKCLKSCSDSTDCQSGNICNTSQGDGVCEAITSQAPAEDSGCGCRTVGASSTDSNAGYAWLLMLSLVGLRRRRTVSLRDR